MLKVSGSLALWAWLSVPALCLFLSACLQVPVFLSGSTCLVLVPKFPWLVEWWSGANAMWVVLLLWSALSLWLASGLQVVRWWLGLGRWFSTSEARSWWGEKGQLGCWETTIHLSFALYSSSGPFSHAPNGDRKTISKTYTVPSEFRRGLTNPDPIGSGNE